MYQVHFWDITRLHAYAVSQCLSYWSTVNILPPCSIILPSFFIVTACLHGCMAAATNEVSCGNASTVTVLRACSSLTSSRTCKTAFHCMYTSSWLRQTRLIFNIRMMLLQHGNIVAHVCLTCLVCKRWPDSSLPINQNFGTE